MKNQTYHQSLRETCSLKSGEVSDKLPLAGDLLSSFRGCYLSGLLFLIKKTKIGMAMRATSQKSQASMLMGINIEHIYISTFAYGAALSWELQAHFTVTLPSNPYTEFTNHQSVDNHNLGRFRKHTRSHHRGLLLRNRRNNTRTSYFWRHMERRCCICTFHSWFLYPQAKGPFRRAELNVYKRILFQWCTQQKAKSPYLHLPFLCLFLC